MIVTALEWEDLSLRASELRWVERTGCHQNMRRRKETTMNKVATVRFSSVCDPPACYRSLSGPSGSWVNGSDGSGFRFWFGSWAILNEKKTIHEVDPRDR